MLVFIYIVKSYYVLDIRTSSTEAFYSNHIFSYLYFNLLQEFFVVLMS